MKRLDDELDPRLQGYLDALREASARDPQAAARGREQFLNLTDSLGDSRAAPVSQGPIRRLIGWIGAPLFPTLGVVLAVLALFFGGLSLTAYAANKALPGSPLYPLKAAIEEAQLSVSGSDEERLRLHVEFAARRANEIAALAGEGQFGEVPAAARQFESHVLESILAWNSLAESDPGRAEELAGYLRNALDQFGQFLSGLLPGLPEQARLAVETAVAATRPGEIEVSGQIQALSQDSLTVKGLVIEIGGQTQIEATLSIGDMVRVLAEMGFDGTLVARQIEVLDEVEADQEELDVEESSEEPEAENTNENIEKPAEGNTNEDDEHDEEDRSGPSGGDNEHDEHEEEHAEEPDNSNENANNSNEKPDD